MWASFSFAADALLVISFQACAHIVQRKSLHVLVSAFRSLA